MTFESNQINQEVRRLLFELIAIPSTRGKEGPAMHCLLERITPYVDSAELIFVDDTLMDDRDYAFPIQGISYQDTPNLECTIRGKGNGPKIIFNTHLDVVPPSEGQENAFTPVIRDGVIFGRGACDAKGQAATLFALAMLMKQKNVQPPGDIIFHYVFEEENGGNGTLAMIRRGAEADAAIILEPSELAIIPAVRGAVWFQLKTYGQAGHSGSKGSTVSALAKAIQGMQILEVYHDRLLSASRGIPLFDDFEDPMPITFGQCTAGKWPASVPSEAVVRGVLGFLTNKNRFEIQEEMRQAILKEGDAWLREHFELTFPMLNSDGNFIPVDHPLTQTLVRAARKHGLPGDVRAMTAACDAWFYNNQAKIPTVVFGPGSLTHAHSQNEQIRLEEILTAAAILLDFVLAYDHKR
jgi:acetylornithine deacetylase/succinyl-diaminopimelate desuccinylase-like protein